TLGTSRPAGASFRHVDRMRSTSSAVRSAAGAAPAASSSGAAGSACSSLLLFMTIATAPAPLRSAPPPSGAGCGVAIRLGGHTYTKAIISAMQQYTLQSECIADATRIQLA